MIRTIMKIARYSGFANTARFVESTIYCLLLYTEQVLLAASDQKSTSFFGQPLLSYVSKFFFYILFIKK